jgi:uncharacterized protein (TIGR03663 family)
MKRWSALAALLLTFAAALALRLPHLSARPLHNDEAVNAIKVTELWEQGRYAYDPDEYHGPTLHYATLPFLWLSGAKNAAEVKDSTLRLAPVFFGAALILLLPLFRVRQTRDAAGLPHPGRPTCNGEPLQDRSLAWSALFIAISPAMVFYSRYFIHEMLLVFFTALLLGSGWQYFQNPRATWAALAGASLGMMYATKETFVISIAAIIFAGFGTRWLGGARRSARAADFPDASESSINRAHITFAFAAALLVWLLFFSSFFTNLPGLANSIRTYLPWLKRAGGHSPHIHPWYFYLQRLAWFHPAKSPVWSEGLILALAAAGAFVSLRRKAPLALFIAIYTIILTAAYSAISYKTPWCLLNFLFGMILLAGIGASALIAALPNRITKTLALATLFVLSAQLAYQSYRASFVMAADRRNPYVYAQTVPDLLNLVEKVESIAAFSAQGADTVVKIISPGGDYWPLPWYLRRFKNVGWYDKMPDDPFAPIIVAAAQMDARLDEKSDKKWIMVGYTEMRPQKFLELYVEAELWKKYVASLPKQQE